MDFCGLEVSEIVGDVPPDVLGALDHVRHYCAGCGEFSCASSVEHQIIHLSPVHHYSVEDIINAVKRAGLRHKVGCDVHRTFLSVIHSKQLYGHSPALSHSEIFRGNAGDPLTSYLFIGVLFAGNQRRKNRYLPCGVVAFNVSSRVTFSKTLLLSFTEGRREIFTRLHVGEYVVACTVEDSCNQGDFLVSA